MSPIRCPACQADLVISAGTVGPQLGECGTCRSALEVEVFPAQWRVPQGGRAGERITAAEAACYVHADRRAEAACDRCGRFMCSLCAVAVGAQRICVACLDAGRFALVERSRTLFGVIAMRVALFGLLLGPFAPVAALSAIVLAVVGFTRPGGITGNRYVATACGAIVLALVTTGLWAAWWIVWFAS